MVTRKCVTSSPVSTSHTRRRSDIESAAQINQVFDCVTKEPKDPDRHPGPSHLCETFNFSQHVNNNVPDMLLDHMRMVLTP